MSLFDTQIAFNRPGYLFLMLAIPLLWFWSFRSLAGLGRSRRLIILSLTSCVVALLAAALAEVQWQRISDRMTVIYLLDQSFSIPQVQRQAMMRYVDAEVGRHRNRPRQDRAGVIIFGRDPAVEVPPFEDDVRDLGRLESLDSLRRDATNLESALKMAQAMFADDTSKRVVIVTDGNENMGDAKSAARALADSGVGIDVVPVELAGGAEVAVERISIPPDARQGQPTEVRIVVNNYSKPTEKNPTGEAKGKLKISRTHDGEESNLDTISVTLTPGKNVYKLDTTLEKTGAYNYRAEFVPDPESNDIDFMTQNNVATGFTQVRGKGRVLFIEHPDKDRQGEFRALAEALQALKLEVKRVPSNLAFNSLAELQGFDTIVLANVPRAGVGSGGSEVVGFTDEQVMMLVRNVEQMGAGLVMIGGDQSFGAGGWAGTELEKIMPVDFQIKNAAVKPNGALALLMHASEMAQGNFWQKQVGVKAIKMLGPNDYCGVLHWDDFTGGDNWLWKGGITQVGKNQGTMVAQIGRMTPGDMPDFDSAMKRALSGFLGLQGAAATKHMIIISDGDPAPPSPAVITALKKAGVTISTVAIGTHGPPGSTPLQSIATATGGKYYVVSNASALPSIYISEVSKIAKPLIFEDSKGFVPQITYPHDIMQGIEGPLPPITGFVLTEKKDSPLVEVAIKSPKPDASGENGTILAAWQYKAGRTVVFTTDAGQQWAKDWVEWPNYGRLFNQMVRWSMRPVNEQGKFTIATDLKDGKVRVVVTALTEDDEFLNFLNMAGSATPPDPTKPPVEISMRQEAPGRYVGEFSADDAGSYFLAVSPGKDYGGPLLAGVSVPYSAEFRERETNLALLEILAKLKPTGGEAGQLIATDIATAKPEDLTKIDTFRATLATALSSQDAWPLAALLAACLFLVTIAVRRISFDPEWFAPVGRLMRKLWRRGEEPAPVEQRLDRLRNLKDKMSGELEERRAATRFEPEPGAQAPSLEDAMREGATEARPDSTRPGSPSSSSPEPEEESYTDRLLKAKRKAQKKNDNN